MYITQLRCNGQEGFDFKIVRVFARVCENTQKRTYQCTESAEPELLNRLLLVYIYKIEVSML